MDFNFDLKKFTDWVMEFLTGKAKSTASGLSEQMSGFAGFLKALGITGTPVELAESGAAAIVTTTEQLTAEARKAAPDLVAQAAAAAKAAANTQVALAPPADPTPPTGQKPTSTERSPA
jgi:hypothetical protein